ncbi:MAG TPA: heparan N-sulfatase, partial [Bacteroidia bacterium]|nr:heparan N-sulfatase [Bacteroidia bacterium]
RPAVELYDLAKDPEAVANLADAPEHEALRQRLEAELTTRLQEQGDPRMFGRGHVFDEYPIHTDKIRNFHERFLKGGLGKSDAGWVNPTDFEPAPIPPNPVKSP